VSGLNREAILPVSLVHKLADSGIDQTTSPKGIVNANGCHRLIALVAGCVMSVTALGCAKSSTAPEPEGRIELTVAPTTASYAGGVGVGGAVCPAAFPSRWGPYTWTLREVGGGTVTVTSFKYAVATIAGVQLADDEVGANLSADFTGTPGSSVRLDPNATLTSRTHYDCEALGFPGGTARFTATGTNEDGAVVTATATLALLPQ
jgi:hypothetical protein